MADEQLLIENNINNGVGGDDIFVYTGGEQQVPRDVKRVRIAENVESIPQGAFRNCEQLIEVEGHDKLKKIEEYAFHNCRRLRRLTKMTGVVEIKMMTFSGCNDLSDVEFDKLEIIGSIAFDTCNSLRTINMTSVRMVGWSAFQYCSLLTDAVFGEDLEWIDEAAFRGCTSLRSISIPLKDNLIAGDIVFFRCNNLSRVDIVGGRAHKTISSLHLESWKNEIKEEIESINQALPDTRSVEMPAAIRQWIRSVIDRMEHYKNEHQLLLKETMTLLELALWKANLHENAANDAAAAQEGVRVTRGRVKRARKDRCITSGASIVINNVLPFLALK